MPEKQKFDLSALSQQEAEKSVEKAAEVEESGVKPEEDSPSVEWPTPPMSFVDGGGSNGGCISSDDLPLPPPQLQAEDDDMSVFDDMPLPNFTPPPVEVHILESLALELEQEQQHVAVAEATQADADVEEEDTGTHTCFEDDLDTGTVKRRPTDSSTSSTNDAAASSSSTAAIATATATGKCNIFCFRQIST